jgi:hypothetical protein
MFRGFDAYNFPARVIPVVLVCLAPLVLVGAGVLSGARSAVASGLVLTAVGSLAGQLGRDRGKKLEPSLWTAWGGSPTLRRLRYRDTADVGVVARLHSRIEDVLGDSLPTQSEEATNHDGADALYEEAIRRMIALTRNPKQFGLLLAENVNYGMRRNMLGLRRIGIAVALATGVLALVLLLLTSGPLASRATRYGPALGIGILELALFGIVVRPDWVRVPAEAYADRLLESVDVLRAQQANSDRA